MLKTSLPSRARRTFGASLIAMSVLLVGSVAWAAQPAAQAKPGVTSKAVPVRGVSMSLPTYPKDAQDQKLGGNVVLIVDVAADGSVSKATIDHAEPVGVFDASALEAVKGWKFTPAMKNGKPVSSQVRVPISFDPNGDPDKRNAPGTTTPARLTMATQASEWSSYDKMVSSFSASWQPPAPATDGC